MNNQNIKEIFTETKEYMVDFTTPVAAYAQLRDLYAGSILLESSDYNSKENSRSIIALNPLYEMIGVNGQLIIMEDKKIVNSTPFDSTNMEKECINFFDSISTKTPSSLNGFLGYLSYDAFVIHEGIRVSQKSQKQIPDIRYALYEFVLVFDHYTNRTVIYHNQLPKYTPTASISEIYQRLCASFSYQHSILIERDESVDLGENEYLDIVKKGKEHCRRGDVFQVVLSRSFARTYQGDEFMIYRKLRTVNPSPYLFYFDYIDYQLLGSSPESQLIISDSYATVHPIAGTYQRTGKKEEDYINAQYLLKDEKENAEHNMLVDLARNDLSKFCDDVHVSSYKEIQMYSHVIHLVSEVKGNVQNNAHPFSCLLHVSPAGTLSGAPKRRAMELIETYEKTNRGFYAGCVGMISFEQTLNHAIIIRSCLLMENKIYFRAGAGIVDASIPEKELQEVYNKVNAMRKCFDEIHL